jgi:hypothetical protein
VRFENKFLITQEKDFAMFANEDTNSVTTLLNSLSQNNIESPSVPVKDLIQEAENLYQWALQDKDALLNAGIKAETIELLHSLSQNLCVAQGVWNSARKSQADAKRHWIEASSRGYKFRDKLVHDFLYAYRNQPDTLSLVREIAMGNGYTDMIQDLMNLKAIGTDHPEALGKINFDVTQLTTAAVMAEGLGTLLAVSNAHASSAGSSKVTRDRTYTRLKSIMTEIRECGKYLFYQNAERRQGYRCDYYHRHKNNNFFNLKRSANVPEPIAAAA